MRQSTHTLVELEARYAVLRVLANRLAASERSQEPRPVSDDELRAPGLSDEVLRTGLALLNRIERDAGRGIHELGADRLREMISGLAAGAIEPPAEDAAVIGKPLEHLRRRQLPYARTLHDERGLKTQYQEYVLQRLEGFKNSIGRDELLRLGDEAASQMQAEGQVPSEVAMLETVDRLIMKRLALRPYRRWRAQFLALRKSQSTPSHWLLDSSRLLTRTIGEISNKVVLFLNPRVSTMPLLAAAKSNLVTVLCRNIQLAEQLESRAAAEALSSNLEVFVGTHLPQDTLYDAVIVDDVKWGKLQMSDVAEVQRITTSTGINAYASAGAAVELGLALLKSAYRGWQPKVEQHEDGATFVAGRR